MDSTTEENQQQQQQEQQQIKKKRKLVRISISDKLKVIEKLENGVSGKVVSELFGISKGQVSDIKRQATAIKAYAGLFDNDPSKIGKRVTKTRSKEFRFDATLYSWYKKQCFKDIKVQTVDFFAAAQKIKRQLGYTGVVCDRNWLIRYKQRHNIKDSEDDFDVDDEFDIGTTESLKESTAETKNLFSAHGRNVCRQSEECEEGAVNQCDIVIKEEVEMRECDFLSAASASEGDVTDRQDDDESLSLEKFSLRAARMGIDDVITYIGYSSNPALWSYYEHLRAIKELIIKDQKKFAAKKS